MSDVNTQRADAKMFPAVRLFDWQKKKARCWMCGTDKSVKYTMKLQESGGETQNVYLCSICALPFMELHHKGV